MIRILTRYLLFFLLLVPLMTFGQRKLYEKGLTAYKEGFYTEVIDIFTPLDVSSKDVDIELMLAHSYSHLQDPVQAAFYYGRSRSLLWPFSSTYMLDYGNVLRLLGRYEEAEHVYRSMGQVPEDLVASCIWSRQEVLSDRFISVSQIPVEGTYRINGISKSGDRLLMSIQEEDVDYELTLFDLRSGERALYMESYSWPFNLNRAQELGDSVLIYSGNASKERYLTSKALRSGKISRRGENMLYIYMMNLRKDHLEGESFDFNNPEYGCTHPFMSIDGRRLYFVSNMPGGYGGFDLYYVECLPTGWSDPINMGKEINTIYDEGYPYEKDGVLFFSSKGHIGYGGYDVFMVSLGSEDPKVVNLGKPINSSRDDISYIEDSVATGYFLSNRFEGTGKDQLWHFRRDVEVYDDNLKREMSVLTDSIYEEVLLFREEQLLLGCSVRGVVVKGDNERVSPYVVPIPDPLRKSLNDIDKVDRSSYLSFVTPDAVTEAFTYDEDGCTIEQQFSSVLMDIPLQVDIDGYTNEVSTYWVGRDCINLRIDYLFFDFDSDRMTYSELKKIDLIAGFLQEHPNYRIQLKGYADSIGDSNYNRHLSKRRAERVASCLKFLGITTSRIVVSGEGDHLRFDEVIDANKVMPLQRVVRFQFE
ncbi:OmpA family protein [Halosquirtibacter xylanolyticus]|uniref:OmpA family protein n=1 Tax=Halosquirtibacter xylanolyticus TaxID=3374599 RepID=UPI0037481F8D|nr:OmpA family protein [Prolixibacteraceae bacterium]